MCVLNAKYFREDEGYKEAYIFRADIFTHRVLQGRISSV